MKYKIQVGSIIQGEYFGASVGIDTSSGIVKGIITKIDSGDYFISWKYNNHPEHDHDEVADLDDVLFYLDKSDHDWELINPTTLDDELFTL